MLADQNIYAKSVAMNFTENETYIIVDAIALLE
jgi:hypothetical protein